MTTVQRAAQIHAPRLFGLFPVNALGFVSPDMFGLVPIGDHDIWLHAGLGIGLAAVGFTARPAGTVRTTV